MSIKAEYAPQLIDWYWEYGSKRQGAYTLSRGGWLDRALRMIREYKTIERASTQFAKPTMALWGPSQSGKSTLLAPFIDAGVEQRGYSEALCWGGVRARFSLGETPDEDIAVLNPFNNGSDASSCVTRFTLRRPQGENNPDFTQYPEVEYPTYPIEIEFADEHDILLSLAVGYLSETNGKDAKGEEVLLSPEKLEEITQRVVSHAAAVTNREAYTLLVEVVNVMDTLIDMEFSRYSGLRAEWPQRRMDLLSRDALISSTDVVRNFAAALFWDAWPNLTSVYRKLSEMSRQFPSTNRYFCDVRTAGLLLDMSAISNYQHNDAVKERVTTCRCKEISPGVLSFSTNAENGSRLFSDIESFALIQALVSIITVPLRCDVMLSDTMPCEVRNVMAMADLLDFPGVANENRAAEGLQDTMLDLDYQPTSNATRPMFALTKLMKRGKTASIVLSRTRDLNIDTFSLLLRMPDGHAYPSHPDQLKQGICSWFKAMGIDTRLLTTDPIARQNLPVPQLKTNLVLTFSAKLINTVLADPKVNLNTLLERLDGLGILAAPHLVTTTWINYPERKREGTILTNSEEELKNALNVIHQDMNVRTRFPHLTIEELQAMADCPVESSGGRLGLFRKWENQLAASPRLTLLREKQQKLLAEWEIWREEALPEANNDDRRKSDLNMVIAAAENPKQDFKSLAREILSLENITPDILNSLPRSDGDERLREYASKQIELWLEAARMQPLQTRLGFENKEHRSRVLGYLAAKFGDGTSFMTWLRSIVHIHLNNENQRSHDERKEMRRLVATYMVNELFSIDTPHRTDSESISMLNEMGKRALDLDADYSPYRLSVILPFVSALKNLRDTLTPGARAEQPGDDVLRNLLT